MSEEKQSIIEKLEDLEKYQARINEMHNVVEKSYADLEGPMQADLNRFKNELSEAKGDRLTLLQETIEELENLIITAKKNLAEARKLFQKSTKSYEREKRALIKRSEGLP
jgi:hypothetical protein